MKRLLAVLLLCCPCILAAQTLPADAWQTKTLHKLHAFDAEWDGVLGVAALDVATGNAFGLNMDVVFPQASVIKIAVLIEVFRQADAGAFDLDEAVTIDPAFLVAGSGRFQEEMVDGQPLRKTLREIAEAMMIWSDNVATNVLIDRVGMAQVNLMLKQFDLGQTRLQRVMLDGDAVGRNDENISTPREMVRLMHLIYTGKAASPESCAAMLAMMQRTEAEMRATVPAAIPVAAKPGWIPGSRSETGLIYLEGRPFILSVMSAYNGPGDPNPVPGVTALVYDHFERIAHSNLYGHRTNVPLQ